MHDEIPVVCTLSDAELRKREATLLAEIKSAVIATEELNYASRIPGDRKWLAVVNVL